MAATMCDSSNSSSSNNRCCNDDGGCNDATRSQEGQYSQHPFGCVYMLCYAIWQLQRLQFSAIAAIFVLILSSPSLFKFCSFQRLLQLTKRVKIDLVSKGFSVMVAMTMWVLLRFPGGISRSGVFLFFSDCEKLLIYLG